MREGSEGLSNNVFKVNGVTCVNKVIKVNRVNMAIKVFSVDAISKDLYT